MRLPAEQRRRQLLAVALDEFADSGFHSTSMDDVASRAGVTKPVLYQHFPSKRALYIELLEDVGNQLMAALVTATMTADTMRDRVAAGFGAYFTFVSENRSVFHLLFGASVRNDEEFTTVVERVINGAGDAITMLIDAPLSDAHRHMLAHALVGMAEATSRRALTAPDYEFDPVELTAWVTQLAWSGMRNVGSEPDGLQPVSGQLAD